MLIVININFDVEFNLVIISVMQIRNFVNLQHLFVSNLNQVKYRKIQAKKTEIGIKSQFSLAELKSSYLYKEHQKS